MELSQKDIERIVKLQKGLLIQYEVMTQRFQEIVSGGEKVLFFSKFKRSHSVFKAYVSYVFIFIIS